MKDMIVGELDRDEKIVWVDQPIPFKYALHYGKGNFFGGLVGVAFSVFWISAALNHVNSKSGLFGSLFPFFGLPFLAIALFTITAPVRTYLAARKTVYALTTKRALRATFQAKKNIDSTYFAQFGDINKEVDSSGVGNVYFTAIARTRQYHTAQRVTTSPDGFVGIADADKVERLLRQEFQKAVAAMPPPPR